MPRRKPMASPTRRCAKTQPARNRPPARSMAARLPASRAPRSQLRRKVAPELADKDRIFTNLYGQGDWGLEGAKSRGAWRDTATFIERGLRLDHQRGQGARACAGRGGAGSRPRSNGPSCQGRRRRRPAEPAPRQRRRHPSPARARTREILRHDPHIWSRVACSPGGRWAPISPMSTSAASSSASVTASKPPCSRPMTPI